MKISVVIPVYNGRTCVARAIESVRKQTVAPVQLIVVDDGSTDGTQALVRQLIAGDANAMLIERVTNGGPSSARNDGLAHVEGSWIAVLDADDYFLPDRLETLVTYAEAHDLDFVADRLLITYSPDDKAPYTPANTDSLCKPWNIYEHLYNDGPGIGLPYGLFKPVISTKFLYATGVKYDERYRNGEDFHFIVELLLAGGRAQILPYAGYVYLSAYCTYQDGRISIGRSLNRPTRDPACLIEQSDILLTKHGNTLTPLQRALVLDRRKRLANSKHLYDLKQSLSERRFGSTVQCLARHPVLWKDIASFVCRLLRQRVEHSNSGLMRSGNRVQQGGS